VRDLNDPENPYIDEYKPWDLWIFMHETGLLEAEGVLNPWIERSGWEYYDMRIDENGFAVPRLVELRNRLERLKRGSEAAGEQTACTHSISATGIMDPAIRHGMRVAEDAMHARYLPQIPEWLPRRLPVWAMILQSGEVVTCEPAGGGLYLPDSGSGSATCFHRYSADGVLLDSTKPGQLWLQLFFDADKVLEKYNDRKVYFRDFNGYLVVHDIDSGKQMAVYDMDGTRLPRNHSLDDRDGTYFYKIYSSELHRVFEAQSEARGSAT
jgi:hypothetical protein